MKKPSYFFVVYLIIFASVKIKMKHNTRENNKNTLSHNLKALTLEFKQSN